MRDLRFCPERSAPRHICGNPAGHELTHRPSVAIASPSGCRVCQPAIGERAATGRATLRGITADDEYWHENAAHETVEVCRLVAGMNPVVSVE